MAIDITMDTTTDIAMDTSTDITTDTAMPFAQSPRTSKQGMHKVILSVENRPVFFKKLMTIFFINQLNSYTPANADIHRQQPLYNTCQNNSHA